MNWLEIPFLIEKYRYGIDRCREDEIFGCSLFEDCIKGKITRAVHEWTKAAWERNILIQDMVDSAMDER